MQQRFETEAFCCVDTEHITIHSRDYRVEDVLDVLDEAA